MHRRRSGGRRGSRGFLLGLAVVTGLLLGVAGPGAADWTSIGPYGGNVTALAIDPRTPTTLYAGTDRGGIFKSTNESTNWSPVNTGLTTTDIRALALDPTMPTTV